MQIPVQNTATVHVGKTLQDLVGQILTVLPLPRLHQQGPQGGRSQWHYRRRQIWRAKGVEQVHDVRVRQEARVQVRCSGLNPAFL